MSVFTVGSKVVLSDAGTRSIATMRFRALGNTGLNVSILGMGGSGYGNVYGKYCEAGAVRALKKGLDNGVNYIDTAYWYGQGQSEIFLGKALSGIQRERFILATKVSRYERSLPHMFDFSAEMVTKSAYNSLKRLQLDHVDILQIHDVEFAPTTEMIVHETLPALDRLKKQGLCRYIGITGYPISTLQTIVENSTIPIDCVLSYCRLTLNDSSLVNHVNFFKSRKIGIINASPLGMGLLTSDGVQSWHPASVEIKRACNNAMMYCLEQGVDIAHLAINFSASFEEVSTTLVSMNEEETLAKNVKAVLNSLTEHEMQVRDYIMNKHFAPVEVKHWEGVELTKIHEEMNKRQN